ncbi:hypothetical protein GcM3_115030 [Golovinomyces cichoracearum]|uniref:Uncharacterized protein n=1 Tax=Golovinomyces cichoracearum TaxID=62708 RepID=A0A420I889_9PEZI|nr:hypothetical protein GcM3_115030 [Golovinomyces cichoracearum]
MEFFALPAKNIDTPTSSTQAVYLNPPRSSSERKFNDQKSWKQKNGRPKTSVFFKLMPENEAHLMTLFDENQVGIK